MSAARCYVPPAVVNTIILAAALGSAYHGINVLYSLIGLLLISAAGMAAVYTNYYGLCENSGRSKTVARVLMVVLFVVLMVEAFAGAGNINGFAGYGGNRFSDAEAGCVLLRRVPRRFQGGGGGDASIACNAGAHAYTCSCCCDRMQGWRRQRHRVLEGGDGH